MPGPPRGLTPTCACKSCARGHVIEVRCSVQHPALLAGRGLLEYCHSHVQWLPHDCKLGCALLDQIYSGCLPLLSERKADLFLPFSLFGGGGRFLVRGRVWGGHQLGRRLFSSSSWKGIFHPRRDWGRLSVQRLWMGSFS